MVVCKICGMRLIWPHQGDNCLTCWFWARLCRMRRRGSKCCYQRVIEDYIDENYGWKYTVEREMNYDGYLEEANERQG